MDDLWDYEGRRTDCNFKSLTMYWYKYYIIVIKRTIKCRSIHGRWCLRQIPCNHNRVKWGTRDGDIEGEGNRDRKCECVCVRARDKSDHGRAFVGRHSRHRKLLGAAEPIARTPPQSTRFSGSKAFIKRTGGGGLPKQERASSLHTLHARGVYIIYLYVRVKRCIICTYNIYVCEPYARARLVRGSRVSNEWKTLTHKHLDCAINR